MANSVIYLQERESYSTAEVAAALGRTPQSVTKAIRGLGLETLKTKRAGYRLNAEQVAAIADSFEVHIEFQKPEGTKEEKASADDGNQALQGLIEALQTQLERKDEQIKKLNEMLERADAQNVRLLEQNAEFTALIASLTDTNKALSAACAARAITENQDALAIQQPVKKTFFQRLFNR